jgi:hypothetical protein
MQVGELPHRGLVSVAVYARHTQGSFCWGGALKTGEATKECRAA